MTKRVVVMLSILLFVLPAFAKDKKSRLPAVILRATRVAVVYEGSGTPLPDVRAGVNSDPRAAVEQALRKWGRFKVMYSMSYTDRPDLIITVRKGAATRPIIGDGSRNERRPPISASDSSITLGTSVGRQVPAGGMGVEIGSPEDTFFVYGGNQEGPILWRYSGRGVLDAPAVRAVQEFRKAIADAEKAEREAKNVP